MKKGIKALCYPPQAMPLLDHLAFHFWKEDYTIGRLCLVTEADKSGGHKGGNATFFEKGRVGLLEEFRRHLV